MLINCPLAIGEIVDKLSILQIKEKKINNIDKLKFIQKEREILSGLLKGIMTAGLKNSLSELERINLILWDIEDNIRKKERLKIFDKEFVDLARAVYLTNDQRFAVKESINKRFDPAFMEVKSYEKYE